MFITDRDACETLDEGFEMLAAEQGGRDYDSDLAAGHDGRKGGSERNLRLAEPYIAADQPVHGVARFEVVKRIRNSVGLVVGFRVGETGDEFLIEAVRDIDLCRGAQSSLCSDFDQFVGNIAEPRLHLRFPGLPGSAAKPVQACRHIA